MIQEAAKGIAKKKIEIQLLAEEKYFLISAKLGLQIDKLSVSCDKNTEKNEKLLKRKEDLEAKYKGLHEENMKILAGKEKDLQKIEEKNSEIRQEIENLTEKKEAEIKAAELRIEKLMKISEAAKNQIREEKDLRLKYQRSVFTMQHLDFEHKRLKSITETQEKKLSILVNLLEASKDHLAKSIQQKSLLLNQTSEAAEKMCELCEETLAAEQKFYEERDYDVMHTPPYIKVKRRPRKNI